MNKARRKDNLSGKEPENEQKEKTKKNLISSSQRKKAKRIINNLLKQFPWKSLFQILPLLIRRCSDKTVIQIAIERIEKQKLKPDERYWLEEIKDRLKQNERIKGTKRCHN